MPTFVAGLIGISVGVVVVTEAWLHIADHRTSAIFQRRASSWRPWSSLQLQPGSRNGTAGLFHRYEVLKKKIWSRGSHLKDDVTQRFAKLEEELKKVASVEQKLLQQFGRAQDPGSADLVKLDDAARPAAAPDPAVVAGSATMQI